MGTVRLLGTEAPVRPGQDLNRLWKMLELRLQGEGHVQRSPAFEPTTGVPVSKPPRLDPSPSAL